MEEEGGRFMSPREISLLVYNQMVIPEKQKYHFAIVLDAGRPEHPDQDSPKSHKKSKFSYEEARQNLFNVCRKLLIMGSCCDLLYDLNNDSNANSYVVLCTIPDKICKEIDFEMKLDRMAMSLRDSDVSALSQDREFSYADRIQLGERALKSRGISKMRGVQDIVPLDCLRYKRLFFQLTLISLVGRMKRYFCFWNKCFPGKKLSEYQAVKRYLEMEQPGDANIEHNGLRNDGVTSPSSRSSQFEAGGTQDDATENPVYQQMDVTQHLDAIEDTMLNTTFFALELRKHYGEKIAIYFSYIFGYTRFLVWPSLTGAFVGIISSNVDIYTHSVLMTLWGFGICTIWAPLWLRRWQQDNEELKICFGVFTSDFYENSHYEHRTGPSWLRSIIKKLSRSKSESTADEIMQQIPQTNQQAGVTPPETQPPGSVLSLASGSLVEDDLSILENRALQSIMRIPVQVCAFLFLAGMCAVMAVVTFILVHFYLAVKSAPSCPIPEDSLYDVCYSGFGRWLTILVQGMMLGLVVDIAQLALLKALAKYFTRFENHESEENHEKSYIVKIFIYDWIAMYIWFWILGFVYVPFGESISEYINHFLHHPPFEGTIVQTVMRYDYAAYPFDLSDAFITPLVITQILNFLLDTLVPFISAQVSLHNLKNNDVSSSESTPEALLHRFARAKELVLNINIYLRENSPNRRLQREMEAVSTAGFGQQTYIDVLKASSMSQYDISSEYNDMVMQFGYVVMFSVIWPWIPLCAFLNNIIEIQGDLFCMLETARRVVPRRTTNIGMWEQGLYFVTFVSVLVNVALICLSTGYLEQMVQFHREDNDKLPCNLTRDFPVLPDLSCLSSFSRFAYIFFFEHFGLGIQMVVLFVVKANPRWVRERMLEKQNVARKQLMHIQYESVMKRPSAVSELNSRIRRTSSVFLRSRTGSTMLKHNDSVLKSPRFSSQLPSFSESARTPRGVEGV